MVDTSGSFADVLRDAIGARGLGLDRIRERLESRGVPVSVATLSYWQSGRSQPERKRSLEALPHLEDVLGLTEGTLRRALASPRARGRRGPLAGLDTVWPEKPHARVLAALDTRWDTELERVSLHDVVTVGADRTERSLVVRQVLRARCDGPDRRVVLHCLDDPRAALPILHPTRGCRRGRTVRDAEGGVVGMELMFWRPLRRGETVVLEYEMLTREPRPRETEFFRRLRLPMREYLLVVRFDPEALPTSCERFRVDGEDETEPLVLDPDRSVHLLDVDCLAGTWGIRWSWPVDGVANRRGR